MTNFTSLISLVLMSIDCTPYLWARIWNQTAFNSVQYKLKKKKKNQVGGDCDKAWIFVCWQYLRILKISEDTVIKLYAKIHVYPDYNRAVSHWYL